jgi:hypothetical protein
MVSQYFKELGHKFKKARKVLTSPDAEYRTKLKHIRKSCRGSAKGKSSSLSISSVHVRSSGAGAPPSYQ